MSVRTAILAVALGAPGLAACGEGEPGAEGPASVVPPDAPIYIEAAIDPGSQDVRDLETLIEGIGKLPIAGSAIDPAGLVDRAFEELSDASGVEIAYDDVRPWLGERAGFAVGSLDQAAEDGVLAVEVTDEAAARATVERLGLTGNEREYDGVEYASDPEEELSVAVFDGFLVLASTGYFEAAVDAARGESLGATDGFADAFAGLDSEALGRMYLDLGEVPDEALADDPGDSAADIAIARAALPELFTEPIGAALNAGGDQVALDVGIGAEARLEASELLGAAPADVVAALGVDDPAEIVSEVISRIEEVGPQAGEPQLAPGSIAEQFDARFGLSLDDALAEFGDGVGYFRGVPGDGTFGLDVTLVEGAGSSDTSAPLQLLTQAGDALQAAGFEMGPPLGEGGTGFSASRSSPGAFINAEVEPDRLTLSYSVPAAPDDAPPAATIDSTELYDQALAALGDGFAPLAVADPAAIVAIAYPPPSVADIAGAATGTASVEAAIVGFLGERLAHAAAGTRTADERLITRLVVGLD